MLWNNLISGKNYHNYRLCPHPWFSCGFTGSTCMLMKAPAPSSPFSFFSISLVTACDCSTVMFPSILTCTSIAQLLPILLVTEIVRAAHFRKGEQDVGYGLLGVVRQGSLDKFVDAWASRVCMPLS